MGRQWAGLYARGGGRDVVRMAAGLPRSDAIGDIANDALFGTAGLPGLNASLTQTDATDVVSAEAQAFVAAALALTDGTDTAVSEASAPAAVSLSLVDGEDAAAGEAVALVAGSLDVSDGEDTVSALAEGAEEPGPEESPSLGGRRWRMDYPLTPDKRVAKLWRLDDDDTARALAVVADAEMAAPEPSVAMASVAANDGSDSVASIGKVYPFARIIRTTPKATLRRAA